MLQGTAYRLLAQSLGRHVAQCYTAAHLADKGYWDNRYQDSKQGKQHFDWLADADSTLENVLPYIKSGARVLDLGCGTSSFATKLCKACPVPVHVVCLDYSVEGLKSTRDMFEQDLSESGNSDFSVHFVQADGTKIPFQSNTFDVILDKGTTDSVLKLEDEKKAFSLSRGILSESLRLLAPTGVYLQITDEDPDLRMSLLNDLLCKRSDKNNVRISHRTISEEESWEYFMYVLSINKD